MSVFLLVTLLLAAEPSAGDRVRVETADLVLEGVLVRSEEAGLRLALEGGELVVPHGEVLSVAVTVPKAPPPPPPPKPALPPLRVPMAPTVKVPRGVWLTRWPMLLIVDAGVGLGAERKTAIDAKGPALAGGAGASVEGAVPWLSFGGGIRLDRSRATLVSKGGSGCLRADPTTCYSFPGGLTHEVQAIETGLYLKPYYMRGPARMWLRAGGQAAFVEWAYAEGSAAHATGSTTAFGPSVGAGFDWAFAARRSAVSASIIAGGPLYVEESDDLLGRPWKSSGNPSSSPIRISISYATVLGKTK